ncbi:MAG: TonB-dependent receptor [Robiginitomaculum sp.]|nr:MAG: TonB-dependent receptor [Robiginitomaculum sp.]
MKHNKTGLLASTALIASLALSGTAYAQVDEIIVTATKRETTLKETPISVSVTSAATIEAAKILDISDLQSVVPSLRVSQLQNSQQSNFIIRGFGNGANNAGIEPSVGVFVDGVYRSRSSSRIGDLPKLERIEVLSGPQSTLFGKNASAGVISIATAKPSYDTEGYVEASLGNYNQRLLKAYVTTGISDNAAVSLGGSWNKRDGFSKPINSNLSDVNDRDRWNVRGQLLVEPTDNVTFRVIADYSKLDEICCAVTTVTRGPTAAAIEAVGGQLGDDADPFSYISYLEEDPTNYSKDRGISAHLDVDFDGFALTSISSYRKNNAGYSSDVDFTSAQIVSITDETDIKTLTQELRLTSTGDRQLDWMVGAYYFNEDIKQDAGLQYGTALRPYFSALFATLPGIFPTIEALYGLPSGTIFSGDAYTDESFTQDNTAISLFGTTDYHMSDQFTLTVGLNYTKDKKTVTGSTVNTDVFSSLDLGATGMTGLGVSFPTVLFGSIFQAQTGLAPTAANIAAVGAGNPAALAAIQAGADGAVAALQGAQFQPPFLAFGNSVESGKTNDDKVTWTVRAAYEVSENVNVYASAASGFKSTSWNLSRDSRPFATDLAALTAAGLSQTNQGVGTRYAGPEEALVYELGIKARFENAAFNVAVFTQTIEGFQDNLFLGAGFVLANAGKQRTKGIEFDATYTPVQALKLTLAGAILDPKYVEYTGAPGPNNTVIDRSGEDIPAVSKLSLSGSATYSHDFTNGMSGYLRGDYQYDSKVQIHAFFPGVDRKVSVANASLGLKMNNGLSMQLWARNLFNSEYLVSAFPAVIQTGTISGYSNPPRTYGISLRKDF